MIDWCRRNLAPPAPQFSFVHHDVFEVGFNPDGVARTLPLPVQDRQFTLSIATTESPSPPGSTLRRSATRWCRKARTRCTSIQ